MGCQRRRNTRSSEALRRWHTRRHRPQPLSALSPPHRQQGLAGAFLQQHLLLPQALTSSCRHSYKCSNSSRCSNSCSIKCSNTCEPQCFHRRFSQACQCLVFLAQHKPAATTNFPPCSCKGPPTLPPPHTMTAKPTRNKEGREKEATTGAPSEEAQVKPVPTSAITARNMKRAAETWLLRWT